MEHPEEHYYKLNRFLLSVTGLWPYQSTRNALLIRTVFTVIVLSSAAFQVTTVFTSEINMEYIIDLMPALLPTIGSLFHLYARVIHIDKLKELFDRVWSDWTLPKTDDEAKIMHEYAVIARLLTFYLSLQNVVTLLYLIWTFTPEILDFISPMNETRPRMQPIKVEYFIDEERYFYFIRFHICIVFIASTTIFIACCTTFLALMQHICGMCELLGYRAERLFYVVENDMECDLTHGIERNRRNTIAFVRLHHDIIQFVSLIETFHTIPFLLDFIGVALSLTFTLTQMLTIAGDMERALRSIGFAVVQMYYIFLCNYMGQRITDMNWRIHQKVYNSAWYDAVVSEQKSLMLIIKRCFHPLVLTACKFYPLSLQSFGMILQTATSYCIFVRQF